MTPGSNGAGQPAQGSSSDIPVSGEAPVSDEAPIDVALDDAPPSEMEDPSTPSEEPGLRECDDGAQIFATVQWAIDALAGCTSLYGLSVSGDLDLKPLVSLRRVGLGAVNIAANVTSLEGLENLEEATRFSIYGSAVRSLAPLSSLRHVEAFEYAGNRPGVASFGGLEKVGGIRILRIFGNEQLESLSGLSLSGEFEYVVVEDNPRLFDVEALSGITLVERDFTFADSAAEVLRLTELQRVLGTVSIHSNAALFDLFLPNAVSLNRLELRGNQPITATSFERLEELRELVLENNGVIRDMPAFPALTAIERARVVHNPELTALTGFSSLIAAGEVDISYNEKLASIDLRGLQEAGGLYVYRNTALDGPSMADGVSGAFISRNRVAPTQDSLPIEPCPWTQDDYCDGDPVNRWAPAFQLEALCRAESDPACVLE